MIFRGREAFRAKIIINYQIIEQMSHFNCLGNNVVRQELGTRLGEF